MDRATRRRFRGDPAQVRFARRFVREALASQNGVADVVELLVSETVTNAVLHTVSGAHGGTFEVACGRYDGTIRVEVCDAGTPSAPQSRRQPCGATSGRGLALVDALADAWGVQGDESGRTVWFELRVPHEDPR